jgi:cation diffusion facilitator family transporter
MDAAERKLSVARLSVASNTLLVCVKMLVGLLMGSIGVVSEALHSGIDLVAAIIARYSVKRSSEPADSDHRYGHGKYENLSGFIEGALIFVAAGVIVYEAVDKIVEPAGVDLLEAGMAVMALSVVVNVVVSSKLMAVAKETDSLALEADALHLKTDVWTSLGVLVALGIIYVTGLEILDPMIALFVAALIIRAAFDITRRSSEGLLDKSLPEAEVARIEGVLARYEYRYLEYHRLRTRKMGSERQIDLHLTVPHHMTVKESHDLVEEVERDLGAEFPGSVTVVHVEPCRTTCDECRMTAEERIFRGRRK